MVIGYCQIDLYLPLSSSLKSKRGILKGLLERIRHRFNVGVAEIEDHEEWKRAKIGMVAISNEKKYLDSLFSKIISYLEGNEGIEIINYTTEFF